MELQSICANLLSEKKVDLIIGYARGTLALRSTPCIIKDEKEIDKLIFDFTCGSNLATYIQKPKIKNSKIGIIAKGCDGRAVVQYIVEGQIKREDVVIIGVPCDGVVDLKKVREKVGGKEILDYKIEDSKIVLEGRDFKLSLIKQEIVDETCFFCKYPNPPIYDWLLGSGVGLVGSGENRKPQTDEFDKMNSDERWEYFEREISKCIRCYACRNVCPMCYCEECFVDQSNPQWFGKSTNISDTMIFHIVRLLHVAGRCVSCGSCGRVCPIGVNLTPIGIKIEKEILDRFGYTAGLDLEATPPMAAYKEEDKQEFIM